MRPSPKPRTTLGPEAPSVELFADGSCLVNPGGPGGWAFVLRHGDREREESGGDPDTTNNRMEITAVLRGLCALKRPCRVSVVSDSQYVVRSINEWLAGWKRKGWRRSPGAGGELQNLDLWKELDALLDLHEVRAHWVRGHDGHPENERCDELARAAATAVSRRGARPRPLPPAAIVPFPLALSTESVRERSRRASLHERSRGPFDSAPGLNDSRLQAPARRAVMARSP